MTRKAELDEQAVVGGYLRGLSYRDLAVEFGVSMQPIQRILKEHNVKPRPKRGGDRGPRLPRATARSPQRFIPAERADIAASFLAGETQVAIARRCRCGVSTVARILRDEGIPAGSHGQRRDHHHNWKGGRVVHPQGYVMVRPESDDVIGQAMKGSRRKYVLEHRLVMAHSLGRPLTAAEQVHHVNGDKADNRLANLQLRNGPHGKGAAFRCADCGSHNVVPVGLH